MSILDKLIDSDRIDQIYSELETMTVELDPDPLRHGPEALQDKTAKAQNFLSRVERITTQVGHEYHISQRVHLSKSKTVELKTKHLIASDEDVAKGSSIKDRISRAHVKLEEEVLELDQLEIAIQDYELVIDMLKTKRSELKNLQQRIKDQFRMAQEEISLGGKWGRPRKPYAEMEPGQGFATFDDMEDVDQILEDVDDIIIKNDEEEKNVKVYAPEVNKVLEEKEKKDSSDLNLPDGDTGLNSKDVISTLEALEIENQSSISNEELEMEDILSSL